MAQLPSGAAGAAAGVLTWSFTCLFFNAVLLWLLWTSNERRSFIFLVACVTFLASTTSVTEQIHDILYWNDAMTARLAWIKAETDNPLVAASDGCTGLDLVTWSIRWACYVTEAGLAFFWAFSLTQAVYCWRDDIRHHRALTLVNQAGKPFAFLAAALTMAVLQAPSLQESYTWWNFVLNFFYSSFCGGGLIMFLLILLEYAQTRRMFRRMNSQQRKEYLHEPGFVVPGHGRTLSNATSVVTMARRPAEEDAEHFGALRQREGGIYDKYLIARAFIPFIALCLFEVDNILINNSRPEKMRALARTDEPDLSAATAAAYLIGFIPGCLASLVLPVAFGTTRQFRHKLRRALCLAPLRQRRRARDRSFSSSSRGGRGSYENSSTHDVFADMDSDAGILSRHRRLSMEKKLRIEVTYEFEVRNEVVESKDALARAKKDLKLGLARGQEGGQQSQQGQGAGRRDDAMGGGRSRSKSRSRRQQQGGEKGPAAATVVGLQPLENMGSSAGNRNDAPPMISPLDLGRPLPPTPDPEHHGQQELATYPFSVDSQRWDDTDRILPKKPSISFMRGQF